MSLELADDLEGQCFAVPPVRRLRKVHAWKAASSAVDAFEGDPFVRYVQADGPRRPLVSKAVYWLLLLLWTHTMMILTINAGSSLIVASPVKRGRTSPIDRLVNLVMQWATAVSAKFLTAEQKKRRQEIDEKTAKLNSDVLGDRMKDMIYVNLLATEPRSQGHGYGTALLNTVTSYGDTLGQACYLHTATHQNVLFYNSLGFKVSGEALFGDDNPKWQEDPVIFRLMVREPKTEKL